MTAIEIESFEPGSAEWVEQRRRRVGGSEIAALMGLGKWESRFSLWHRKQGTIAAQQDNPEMEWGRRLEPVILGKYADNHGPLQFGGTFLHGDRPWQLASPDARNGGGIVEAKTAHDDRDALWGDPGSDEIPVYYRAQGLWYCDVLAAEWFDIAVLIGGSDYREYHINIDAAARDEQAQMRAVALEFLADLEGNVRPDIDAHQATYQAVRELHPEIELVDVEIPMELAVAYCRALTECKQAEDEKRQQTAAVADFIGTARRATFLGSTIATRQARGDGTPYLVAGRNLPDFLPKAG